MISSSPPIPKQNWNWTESSLQCALKARTFYQNVVANTASLTLPWSSLQTTPAPTKSSATTKKTHSPTPKLQSVPRLDLAPRPQAPHCSGPNSWPLPILASRRQSPHVPVIKSDTTRDMECLHHLYHYINHTKNYKPYNLLLTAYIDASFAIVTANGILTSS